LKPWTQEELSAAAACVQDSSSIKEALKRISGLRPIGDAHALANAFKRGGLASPSSMLRKERKASAGSLTGTLVCSDAHHPYVDEVAWATFLQAAIVLKPDVLVIIGDFADAYSISSHTKSPERREGLKGELEAVNAALDQIEALGIPRVVQLEGNHEERLTRYLGDRAPDLFGLLDMKSLMRVKERGWEWVPYRDHIQIGHMYYAHDVGRCGKHAASQSLADFGHNLCFGHSHRLGVAYLGTVAGERNVALNVGWLGDHAAIDYRNRAMAMRDWQHGFGWVVQDERGIAWCQAVPIIDGRCIVDGKVIKG
jgi:predicted phosphodiesterase